MARDRLTCLSCYNFPYISPSISSSSYHIQNFFQVFTFSLHEICYFLYVMYSTHHKKFNFCLSFPSQKKFPESSILLHLAKYRFYGNILFRYCSVPSSVFSLALISSIKYYLGSLDIVLFLLSVHAFFSTHR